LECSEPSRGIKIFLIMLPPRSSEGNPHNRYSNRHQKDRQIHKQITLSSLWSIFQNIFLIARLLKAYGAIQPNPPAAKLASSAHFAS
jgi:hypothetical protein